MHPTRNVITIDELSYLLPIFTEGGRSYLYFRDQLALYPASDFPELESENVLG